MTALGNANGVSVLPKAPDTLPTLTFENGRMVGETGGCNSVFGSYEQSGEQGQDLVFPVHDLGSTVVGCKEAPLVARLAEVRHVSISHGVLYLRADEGVIIAELHRRGQRQ